MGGVAAAVAVILVYLKYYKLPIRSLLDITAVGLMLILVFGRIGCFLNGCCYGKPTSHFWGVTFTNPLAQVLDAFGVEKDGRGNAKASTEGEKCYQTSVKKVFAAGDMRRGQSLVVWAIREGRQCAQSIDAFLMGSSLLPR